MSMNLIKLARKLVSLQISADEFEIHFSICGEMKGELVSLQKTVRILESVRLNFLFLLSVIHRIP